MSVMSSVKTGLLRRCIYDCFLCISSLMFPVSNKKFNDCHSPYYIKRH